MQAHVIQREHSEDEVRTGNRRLAAGGVGYVNRVAGDCSILK